MRAPARSLNLPILMYHHIVDDENVDETSTLALSLRKFQQQLDMLCDRRFNAITFRDLFKALAGAAELPRKPVIITFDDAYASFGQLALPELVERKLQATVFVVANAIGRVNYWDAHGGMPLLPLMDDESIKDALKAGMEIGVHGWDHRDLTRCTDDELVQETVQARKELMQRFNCDCAVFCYPYGQYTHDLFERLSEAGYSGAVSIFSEHPTVTYNTFCMRRIYVHEKDGLLRFALKLSPAYLWYVAQRDCQHRTPLHAKKPLPH